MTAIYEDGLNIPSHIVQDPNLKWIDRAAFSIMAKYHKAGDELVNSELIASLQVSASYLKDIKRRLAKAGHLLKIEKSKNEVRYVPVNSFEHARDLLSQFLKRSQFFNKLPPEEYFSFRDPLRLYRWMSRLEHQYQHSPLDIGDPYAILYKCYYKRKLDLSFNFNWWLDEEQKAQAERMRKAQARKESRRADQEKQAYHDFTKNVLPHMTKKEQADLRKRAREILKSNGASVGGEITIRRTMFHLWREEK